MNFKEVEGKVFTYDKVSNVVVLEIKMESPSHISGTPPKHESNNTSCVYKMIRANFIKEVMSVTIPSVQSSLMDECDGQLPKVDMDRVNLREKENIRYV